MRIRPVSVPHVGRFNAKRLGDGPARPMGRDSISLHSLNGSQARARADEYAEEARAALDNLPDSEYSDSLRALPTYILDRDR